MSQQFWNPQQQYAPQAAGAYAQQAAQQQYAAQMAAYQQQQQQQMQNQWMQQQAAQQPAYGFRAGGMNDYEQAYAGGGYGQEEYGCDAKTGGAKHKKRSLPPALKHWNARVSSYVRKHGVSRKEAMIRLAGTR